MSRAKDLSELNAPELMLLIEDDLARLRQTDYSLFLVGGRMRRGVNRLLDHVLAPRWGGER